MSGYATINKHIDRMAEREEFGVDERLRAEIAREIFEKLDHYKALQGLFGDSALRPYLLSEGELTQDNILNARPNCGTVSAAISDYIWRKIQKARTL